MVGHEKPRSKGMTNRSSDNRGGLPTLRTQPFTLHITMAGLMRASRRVFLGSLGSRRLNWHAFTPRRRLTTAASGDAASLPLAGIKVLDMTRVLAGVRDIYLSGLSSDPI
jgi:hypothetical protein